MVGARRKEKSLKLLEKNTKKYELWDTVSALSWYCTFPIRFQKISSSLRWQRLILLTHILFVVNLDFVNLTGHWKQEIRKFDAR
jgi:hypothetical protein